ncbi:hypothetical protein THTE_1472 [Thermogutta terrifontis]|uniref:Uncharacterized protein n=1 Tax=Thermogutta terrifontis TaxID=1331910 RepID=A0A286RDN6_9BACT|nr:hypothetical protein THTE_1472 [Thermogutta terrifontis]
MLESHSPGPPQCLLMSRSPLWISRSGEPAIWGCDVNIGKTSLTS